MQNKQQLAMATLAASVPIGTLANKLCQQELIQKSEELLGQSVIDAKDLGDKVQVQAVENTGHPAMVTLANGMVVPLVENRKQRRLKAKVIQRCIKDNRPIPSNAKAMSDAIEHYHKRR
jgi:hypothetical protein